MSRNIRICMYLFALITLVNLFALRIQAQDVRTRLYCTPKLDTKNVLLN